MRPRLRAASVGKFGEMCFCEQRTWPSRMGWAGLEGVEKLASSSRASSQPLPFVCLNFPLHRLPSCFSRERGSGSVLEALLPTDLTTQMLVDCLGPRFLPVAAFTPAAAPQSPS